MQKNHFILKKSPLFEGINESDLDAMLTCLQAHEKSFRKEEIIFHPEQTIHQVGLVLDGCVHIIREDVWGNRTILAQITSGDLFGETYACLPALSSDITVLAVKPCTILFLDVKRILTVCSSSCTFHSRLIQNLMTVLATKNYMLNQKIIHISKRTTKEKLLSYLSSESIKNNSSSFTIPFNRQQLADYLSVDRSAMSNELCKLRDSGVLKFHKNQFELTIEP